MQDDVRIDREVWLFSRDLAATNDHGGKYLVTLRTTSWRMKHWWALHARDLHRHTFDVEARGLVCGDEIEAEMVMRQMQSEINREFT